MNQGNRIIYLFKKVNKGSEGLSWAIFSWLPGNTSFPHTRKGSQKKNSIDKYFYHCCALALHYNCIFPIITTIVTCFSSPPFFFEWATQNHFGRGALRWNYIFPPFWWEMKMFEDFSCLLFSHFSFLVSSFFFLRCFHKSHQEMTQEKKVKMSQIDTSEKKWRYFHTSLH